MQRMRGMRGMGGRVLVGALAVGVVLGLSGCVPEPVDGAATGSPRPSSSSSVTPEPSPTEQVPVPTITPGENEESGVPTGEALEAWAAAALPTDSPGGSGPVLRETAVIGPRAGGLQADVTQPEGQWTVAIACIGAGATDVAWELVQGDDTDSGMLACAAPPEYAASTVWIELKGGRPATLSLEAQESAGLVYEVTARTSDD